MTSLEAKYEEMYRVLSMNRHALDGTHMDALYRMLLRSEAKVAKLETEKSILETRLEEVY